MLAYDRWRYRGENTDGNKGATTRTARRSPLPFAVVSFLFVACGSRTGALVIEGDDIDGVGGSAGSFGGAAGASSGGSGGTVDTGGAGGSAATGAGGTGGGTTGSGGVGAGGSGGSITGGAGGTGGRSGSAGSSSGGSSGKGGSAGSSGGGSAGRSGSGGSSTGGSSGKSGSGGTGGKAGSDGGTPISDAGGAVPDSPLACPCTRRPGPGVSLSCPAGANQSTSATIGPAGGVVSLVGQQGAASGNGFQVFVPPNAFDHDLTVTVTETSIAPPIEISDWSPIYQVLPFAPVPSSLVTLRLPWSNRVGTVASLNVYFAKDSNSPFAPLTDVQPNAGFIRASTTMFGLFFVGAPKSQEQSSCP